MAQEEHLLILPDRQDAQELAQDLMDDGFTDVSVHREALSGEDDAEDHEWAIHLTSPPGMRAHFEALAAEHDGWYDPHPR